MRLLLVIVGVLGFWLRWIHASRMSATDLQKLSTLAATCGVACPSKTAWLAVAGSDELTDTGVRIVRSWVASRIDAPVYGQQRSSKVFEAVTPGSPPPEPLHFTMHDNPFY